VNLDRTTSIPFLGTVHFRIRATSFQRRWDFYGGPPQFWE